MMAMSKADLTEAGITLRTKAKNAVVLSDADQARVEADEKFLKSIAAGNVDDVIAILDAGQGETLRYEVARLYSVCSPHYPPTPQYL